MLSKNNSSLYSTNFLKKYNNTKMSKKDSSAYVNDNKIKEFKTE